MITKIKTAGTAQQVREIEAKYREPETGLCYGLMQKAGESLYRFIEEKIISDPKAAQIDFSAWFKSGDPAFIYKDKNKE